MKKELKKSIINQLDVMLDADSLDRRGRKNEKSSINPEALNFIVHIGVDERLDVITLEAESDYAFPSSQFSRILGMINAINCKPIIGNFYFAPIPGSVLANIQVLVCNDWFNKAELQHAVTTLRREFIDNYSHILDSLKSDAPPNTVSAGHFIDSPLHNKCS